MQQTVQTTGRVHARRPWAAVVGYSRAVRVGNVIEVGGTSATTPDGEVIAPRDAYLQTQDILHTIADAIAELGGGMEDVVRTRAYLTDISQWEEVGRAHGEVFGDILPASTFVEVSNLLLPDLMVEIEATALVRPHGGDLTGSDERERPGE